MFGWKWGRVERVISFHHKWCREGILKEYILYSIATNGDGVVPEWMDWVGDSLVWALSFRRHLRGEEVRELPRILKMVEKVKIR